MQTNKLPQIIEAAHTVMVLIWLNTPATYSQKSPAQRLPAA